MTNNYQSIEEKPRFKLAKTVGRNFINSLNIKACPVDIMKVINFIPNCNIMFYDLKGEEGYTFYIKELDKYKIVIDNSVCSDKRCKFTIAHEIGHIVLGHLKCNLNIGKQILKNFDHEANVVAGEILMPFSKINEIKFNNIKQMATYFDVSESAMETRLQFLNVLDLKINYQFA